MTAAEKSKELIEKFREYAHCNPNELQLSAYERATEFYNAKQCALICVDIALQTVSLKDYEGLPESQWQYYSRFWNEVRKELMK